MTSELLCHKCGREVTLGDLNELFETIERLESAIDLIMSYRGHDDDALTSRQIRSKQQEDQIADLTWERAKLRGEKEELNIKLRQTGEMSAYLDKARVTLAMQRDQLPIELKDAKRERDAAYIAYRALAAKESA